MAQYSRSEARRWVRKHLRGYFTVLYTPFLPDGEIDEPGLRRNVAATLALPGVGGLSVHSIHQEFWTLTAAERKRVTEIVIDAAGGKAPVIAGVSDNSARNVVDLARHAEAAGADAVMLWPPFYGPRTAGGVRAFYEYVAERIDIGIFAYSTTLSELGYYLAPDQVEALLPIEHLCGVQNTTLDLPSYAAMMERVGNRICVTTSLEEVHLFGKQTFADGRVPDFLTGASRPLFVQNAAQPRCARFLDAVSRKDYAAAAVEVRTIVEIAGKLQSRYFAHGFHHIALSKALTGMFGMATGGTRPPLGSATPEELEECVAILVSAGLIEPARIGVTHTRDDVLAAATTGFQASELASIIAELDLYGIQPHEPERERVQLAIIQLSGGSKEKVLQYVQMAKADYRDILAWKQLGPLPQTEGKKLQNEARALIEKWGKE